MQITQRCILLIGMSLALCFFAAFSIKTKGNSLEKDWEKIQVNIFLNRFCKKGYCSQEDYLFFGEALSRSGNKTGIRIEEYRKEYDLTKNVYYSVVSWEEIKALLWTNERYDFSEDSIILIEVWQSDRMMTRKNRKFGRVIGENGNDT